MSKSNTAVDIDIKRPGTARRPKINLGETPPGEFSWLDKGCLKVDSSYQRTQKKSKAEEIAKEWSWVACGALSVALRDDGEWFVIDGGHRWAAAMLRDDIKQLPCLIFDLAGIADEAGAFLDINTRRRAMTMVDRFNALRTRGDPAAKAVDELLASTGHRIGGGNSSMSVACARTLLIAAQNDAAALARAWPLVVQVCAGRPVLQQIVEGLFYLERNAPKGMSLREKRWADKLLLMGYDAINAAIVKTAAYYGNRGIRVCARAIVELINSGKRSHRFPFKEDQE